MIAGGVHWSLWPCGISKFGAAVVAADASGRAASCIGATRVYGLGRTRPAAREVIRNRGGVCRLLPSARSPGRCTRPGVPVLLAAAGTSPAAAAPVKPGMAANTRGSPITSVDAGVGLAGASRPR